MPACLSVCLSVCPSVQHLTGKDNLEIRLKNSIKMDVATIISSMPESVKTTLFVYWYNARHLKPK